MGQGRTDEARQKLDALLSSRDQLPVSTVNELLALRMALARNLNELLTYAPRTPLGFTDDADGEELPSESGRPMLNLSRHSPGNSCSTTMAR